MTSRAELEYELNMMERVQGLHAYLVEPIKPRFWVGTTMEGPPFVVVSEVAETVEEAAKAIGTLIELNEDKTVAIVEQRSSKTVEEGTDEEGQPQAYLTQADKPLVWRVRVSKTELKFHTPSMSMFTNE